MCVRGREPALHDCGIDTMIDTNAGSLESVRDGREVGIRGMSASGETEAERQLNERVPRDSRVSRCTHANAGSLCVREAAEHCHQWT